MKLKLILCVIFSSALIFYAQPRTLILPITGVQAEEARTIAAFVTMTMAEDAIDESRNTALAPRGGRPWGIGAGARARIVDLISQNNAASAIGISVAQYGAGKIATLRSFDTTGKLVRVLDIQYSDPFEFWIKLQQPVETTRRANGGRVWVIYRDGVNRAEAEELMSLWFSDLVSMGAQGLREIDDQTAGFEAAVKAGGYTMSWTSVVDQVIQYFKNTKIEPVTYSPYYIGNTGTLSVEAYNNMQLISKNIPEGYSKGWPPLIINVSRQGNKTRIEVVRYAEGALGSFSGATGSFVTEYETAAGFRKNMRVNSLRLMDALYKNLLEYARSGEAIRSTWITSAALTNLKTHVAVPNTFIQVTRPSVVPGEVPRGGGFYMAKNMVTQREWEALMGSNPSGQRGDNLPVHNVSLLDAMEYCNRLSLRDGLMPAYDFFYWQGIPHERTQRMTTGGRNAESWTETIVEYRGQSVTVRTGRYASGYRLPMLDEWDFALTSGTSTREQFIRQLINNNEIEKFGWFAGNSDGRVQPVGQKQPINGFYDLLGNIMEFVFKGSDYSLSGRVISGSSFVLWRGNEPIGVRGGDYRSRYDQKYIIDARMPSPALREYLQKDGARASRDQTENIIFAGFRVVRPVLDYWAYRSGE